MDKAGRQAAKWRRRFARLRKIEAATQKAERRRLNDEAVKRKKEGAGNGN